MQSVKRKLNFSKTPSQTGVFLLQRTQEHDLELVHVFMVYDANSRRGEWYYADYPHACVTELISPSTTTKGYRWGFVKP